MSTGVTVKDLANAFLNHKQAKLDTSELSPRTWKNYNWNKGTSDNPISKEMRKLLNALGIDGHRNFYALRHTFETIGGGDENEEATGDAVVAAGKLDHRHPAPAKGHNPPGLLVHRVAGDVEPDARPDLDPTAGGRARRGGVSYFFASRMNSFLILGRRRMLWPLRSP